MLFPSLLLCVTAVVTVTIGGVAVTSVMCTHFSRFLFDALVYVCVFALVFFNGPYALHSNRVKIHLLVRVGVVVLFQFFSLYLFFPFFFFFLN